MDINLPTRSSALAPEASIAERPDEQSGGNGSESGSDSESSESEEEKIEFDQKNLKADIDKEKLK